MASSLPETESQNFYRLVSLLVDNGSVVLRRLVNKYALSLSTSLDQHLSNNKTKLEHLQNTKHVLNQSQMDLLFPTSGGADIEKFDVTLLSCLLKNICGKLPQAEKQAVERLRMLRNVVLGHLSKAKIEENDFKQWWGQISQEITNIAQHIGDPVILQEVKDDIKELLNRPNLKLSSQFTYLMLQWQLSDQGIRDEMEQKHKEVLSEMNKKQRETEMKSSAQYFELLQKLVKSERGIRSDMNKQHTEVKSEIRKVKEDIQDHVEKKNTEIKSEIKQVKEAIQDDVETKTTIIKSEIRQVKEDVKSDIRKVEQNIRDEMEKKNTMVKSEIKDEMDKKHQETEEKLRKNQERLRSNLVAMYEKHYTKIPISPLHEDEDTPIEALFTDVVMVEETKDKSKTKEIPVKSYQDIFYSKDGKVRSIYVLGLAGAGKTVYTKQMVNKWVKTQKQLKSGKVKLETKNEEVMAQYDFLFYVPLRSVEKSDTLLEVICKCVGDDKLDRDTTKYVFEHCPEKALVIFDGLDEIDWFPSRHNFHSFTIVTTTRPWKYDTIKGRSPQKDRILQLRGLGRNGVAELAQRLRRAYYKHQPESSVDNFLWEVMKLGLWGTLNESPLIVVYFLHVWYQQTTQPPSLSTSLTTLLLDVVECILQRGENKLPSIGDFSLSQEELNGFSLGVDRPVCCDYGKLLMIVSEIAFKGLTNTTKEQTLVFSDRNLRSMISKSSNKSAYFEASLKLGLISKSEHNHILHKEHSFSFAHKLFQELFMAIHMINNQTSLPEFYNYCNTLDKVFEMSDVFIFTAVLCKETALQLSKHVVDICDRDKEVLDYRSGLCDRDKEVLDFRSDKFPWLIRRVIDMYMDCIVEHREVAPDDKCGLYISDMYIKAWRRTHEPDWDAMTTLLQTSTCTLKSFYYDNRNDVSLVNKNKTLQQLTEVTSLTHLHLDFVSFKPQKHTIGYVNKILTNNRQLCVLYIKCLDSLPGGLLLPPLPHLQHLSIRHVPILTATLHVEFEPLPQLRTLLLYNVHIEDYIHLSQSMSLHRLILESVTMSGSLWRRLLEGLNNLPALKELELSSPHILDYSDVPAPPADPHLTFINRLHKVEFKDTCPSPVLHHILCSVGDDSQVRRLKVEWEDIPATSVPPLLSAITHSHHLEELVLRDINTGSHHVSLHHNTNLKTLKLEYVTSDHVSLHNNTNLKTLKLLQVTSDHVSLHNNTNLKTLKLEAVTMSPEVWEQLFASIQMLPDLTTLHIIMKYIFVTSAPDPGAASWSRLFISLGSLPQLTELKLEHVNIPAKVVKLPVHLTITDKMFHTSDNTDSDNIKTLICKQVNRIITD